MKLISVGQLIDQTWEHYHTHWRQLMRVTIWLLLPTAVAIVTVAMYPDASTMLAMQNFSAAETSAVVAWFVNNSVLTPIIGLWVFLMTVKMIHAQMENRGIRLSALAKDGWRLFLPTVLVNLLVCLILLLSWLAVVPGIIIFLLGGVFDSSIINGLGIVLLAAGVIAALILSLEWLVCFAYAPLALILEDHRGRSALKRAKSLIKGRFWPVLIRMILPKIVFLAVLLVVEWLVGYLIGLAIAAAAGLDLDLAAKLTNIAVTVSVAIGAVLINPLLITSDYLLFDNLRATEKK